MRALVRKQSNKGILSERGRGGYKTDQDAADVLGTLRSGVLLRDRGRKRELREPGMDLWRIVHLP